MKQVSLLRAVMIYKIENMEVNSNDKTQVINIPARN